MTILNSRPKTFGPFMSSPPHGQTLRDKGPPSHQKGALPLRGRAEHTVQGSSFPPRGSAPSVTPASLRASVELRERTRSNCFAGP